ncbi:MAG: hypothetical protein IPP35_06195 [Elusimicrobia bacterium]|nr:hypothetical protein [Elusimicrobiota bacterium]
MNPAMEYTLTEQAGSILVEWMGLTLPVEIKYIALALLVLLPFLFLFRRAIARFADRHLHIHWSPKVYGLGAPVLSILCGLLLYFAKEPETMIAWNLGENGVYVKSPNGKAKMDWAEIETAVYPEPKSKPDMEALVLKSKDGRQVWMDFSGLAPEHEETVLDFINRSTNNRFNLHPDETRPDDE